MRSVLNDFGIDAMKTGMLLNGDIIAIVVSTLNPYCYASLPILVVDLPVCFLTSGHTPLDLEALSILSNRLLPLAAVITPNKLDAELLLSRKIKVSSVGDLLSAAKAIPAFGSKAVLIKGRHMTASASEICIVPRPGIEID